MRQENKIMQYQIDQSGKIEDTAKDTVIAISNDYHHVLLLKKDDKRLLQEIFRQRHKSKIYIYLTFAVLVAIIIKKVKPTHKVLVDVEYPGHQDLLTAWIISYLGKLKVKRIPAIRFGFIGKSSNAHGLAYKTFKRKIKPDKTIGIMEILDLILDDKKDRVSRY